MLQDLDLSIFHGPEGKDFGVSFRIKFNRKDIYREGDRSWSIRISKTEEEILNKIASLRSCREKNNGLINFYQGDKKFNFLIDSIYGKDYQIELDFILTVYHGRYHFKLMDENILFSRSKILAETVKKEFEKLREEIEKLKEENKIMKTQIEFIPGGPVYLEAKEEFETLSKGHI